MKSIVVIPTYNEKENLRSMIEAIFQSAPDCDVMICDDDSPDGTGKIAEEMAAANPKIIYNPGAKKGGLGKAYIRGFTLGLEMDYDRFVQMDCDFSHDPAVVPVLLRALDENDLALGSRYVFGGRVVNWPWYRKWLSKGGSVYARTILNMPIKDLTGGFKAWRKEALIAVDLSSIASEGYAFQIETTYRAAQKGLRIVQIPITFTDRRVGKTKMSRKIFLEAVRGVWTMRKNT